MKHSGGLCQQINAHRYEATGTHKHEPLSTIVTAGLPHIALVMLPLAAACTGAAAEFNHQPIGFSSIRQTVSHQFWIGVIHVLVGNYLRGEGDLHSRVC